MAIINLNKFIKSDEINHKDIVTINTEGGWEESERFTKDDGTPANQFNIELELPNGEVRSANFNMAQLGILAKAFGKDSAGWVGKQVRAWKTVSAKAKAGFIYLYAPVDWTRDDTGEWVVPAAPVSEAPTTLDTAPDID